MRDPACASRRRAVALGAAAAGTLALLLCAEAWGHGLAERYRLPIPLAWYLAGAGAAVVLSFALTASLGRVGAGRPRSPRWEVPAPGGATARIGRGALQACRALAVGLFTLVLVAGLAGSQSPFHNIAPVTVWVIGWVGLSLASALLGDVWALVNPWKILFAWGEALVRRGTPARARRWPAWLGLWPAVCLLLVWAWIELVWPGRDHPRSLAAVLLAYSAVTWVGMGVFGREAWLRGGEVFAVVFGLLARFAPTELRVTDRAVCRACAAETCREPAGCVNCHDCYARARRSARHLVLRPPAVGLLAPHPHGASMLALVILMLSTVTLDGLTETPLWTRLEAWVADLVAPAAVPGFPEPASPARRVALTLGLFAAPAAAWALYAAVARLMLAAAGARGRAGAVSDVMGRFALTFLPIAIAYHVAHYLPFLLLAGQLAIPLASDPLGRGWDLFGTSLYRLDVGIVDARFIWLTAVGAVVAGHALAVYLAHVTAVATFGGGARALRSQYPMLALMAAYTVLSLWILAQPLVDPAG